MQYVFVLLKLTVYVLWDLILNICITPLYLFIHERPFYEIPHISCQDTITNAYILEQLYQSGSHSYTIPLWLRNPYTQFIYYFSLSSKRYSFRREWIYMEDGVRVAIDIKEGKQQDQANIPTIMMCHGVGGSSGDFIIQKLSDELADRGWRTVVYNRRGHADSSLLSMFPAAKKSKPKPKRIFPMHADLEDMYIVAKNIQERYPKSPRFLAGFSAGSNLVVKFLGDPRCTGIFYGGISVSNAINIDECTQELTTNRPNIDYILTNHIKSVLKKNRTEIEYLCKQHHPQVNISKIIKSNSCRDFETRLLPLYGYKEHELDTYYRDNSCQDAIPHVNVPLLCMHAMDDMCIPRSVHKYLIDAPKQNKNIISMITKHGGHLGWMTGWNKSWSVHIMIGFLEGLYHMYTSPQQMHFKTL